MNDRQLRPLLKRYILPCMPDFSARRGMVVEEPIDWLLKAVVFESSRHTTSSLRLSALVQPLYVPVAYVHMMFARDIGQLIAVAPGYEEVAFAEALRQILSQAIPIFEELRTPGDIATRGRAYTRGSGPEHAFEAVAYSSIIAGDLVTARKSLMKARSECRANDNPFAANIFEEIDRRSGIIEEALNAGQEAAVEVLREWRDYSFNALKLGATASRRSSGDAQKQAGTPRR